MPREESFDPWAHYRRLAAEQMAGVDLDDLESDTGGDTPWTEEVEVEGELLGQFIGWIKSAAVSATTGETTVTFGAAPPFKLPALELTNYQGFAIHIVVYKPYIVKGEVDVAEVVEALEGAQ